MPERELRPHDTDRVATFLDRLAAAGPSRAVGDRLPDPKLLWLRAQLTARWEADRRCAAVDVWAEPAEYTAGAIAVAVLVLLSLPALQGLLEAFTLPIPGLR